MEKNEWLVIKSEQEGEEGEGADADYVLVDGDIVSSHATEAEADAAQEKLDAADDGFHYFVVARKDWDES
jgi:hypothetical protein